MNSSFQIDHILPLRTQAADILREGTNVSATAQTASHADRVQDNALLSRCGA